MGHWGGSLVAFTALVVFMRRSGWPFLKFLFVYVMFSVAWRGEA